jgi:ribosomal protein S14
MLFARLKDIQLRKTFLKKEHENKIYKYVFTTLLNCNINKKTKKKYIKKAFLVVKKKYFYNCQKIKLIKRCIINNRSKGTVKPFNMSRLIFRNLLQFGEIPVYKKAIW